MKLPYLRPSKKRLWLVLFPTACVVVFRDYSILRLLSEVINPSGKGGCSSKWFEPLNKSVELHPEPTPLIKNIFISWQQGIESAPPVVVETVSLWIKNNPAWNVTIITDENEESFLNNTDFFTLFGEKRKHIKRAAYSDMMRIWLLEKYGGAWADATTLNTIPLDFWLPFIVDKDEEFFAFRDMHFHPDLNHNLPISSWFLYGSPRSVIIQKWKQEITEYWDGRSQPDHYFWVHHCLFRVLKRDKELAKNWMERAVFDRDRPHLLQGTKPVNMTCEGFLGLSPMFKLSYYDGKSERYLEIANSLKENNCTFCQNEADCKEDSKVMFQSLKKSCDLKLD